jgi:hypothetical protein
MTRALGGLTLAILIAVLAVPGEASASAKLQGFLDCGLDNCVDIFTFTCSDTDTKYVDLWACDAGPTYDDRMTLTAWRRTNDRYDGVGSIDSVQVGNACAIVRLPRPSPGKVSGLATVSSHGNLSPFEFSLWVFCYDKNSVELSSPSVDRPTSQ